MLFIPQGYEYNEFKNMYFEKSKITVDKMKESKQVFRKTGKYMKHHSTFLIPAAGYYLRSFYHDRYG